MISIKEVYEIAKKFKVNPLAVAVQTYHETGNYRYYRDWNLAGIKCTGSWVRSGGKCWNAKTQEYYGEGYIQVTAGFRSYPSVERFLGDYEDLILRLYPKCSNNLDNVFGYFAGLHGKWATDPIYFRSLVRLLFQLAPQVLEYWDPREELEEALRRKALEVWQIEEVKKYDLKSFGEVPVVERVREEDKRLTKNFKRSEFRCPCCGWADIDMEVVETLQVLRSFTGRQVVVTSGCRCKNKNREVGGSKGSRHLEGKAADFYISGWGSAKTFELVKRLYKEGKIHVGYFYIINSRAVHLDVRRPVSLTVGRW